MRKPKTKSVVSVAILGLIAFIFITPLLSLIPVESMKDTDYLFYSVKKTLTTIEFSLAITILSFLIGGTAGILISFFEVPSRRLLVVLYSAQIVVPSYILAMLFSDLSSKFFSVQGYIFVMSAIGSTYFFLFTYGRCNNLSIEMIGSLQTLGLTWKEICIKCIFPTLRPTLVLCSLVVFAESFNEFGAAYFLGVDTVVTLIYKLWFTSGQIGDAKFLAFGVFGFSFILVIVSRFFTKSANYSIKMSMRRGPLYRLSRKASVILTTVLYLPVLIYTIIPFIIFLKWSYMAFPHIDFHEIFTIVCNTLGVAFSCSLAVVVVCIVIIETAKRISLRIVGGIINNNYFMPGVVIALSVLSVGKYFPVWNDYVWIPFILAILLK
jgi:ABC-type Fe3+ transport system permease subunit